MIYEFKGFIPVVDPSAFVHPQATIIGNVIIGKNVFIGASAVIRGDWGGIIIKDGCNVQENCTIHMFPGTTTTLYEDAHIGHGAIIHGATIGSNVLVGMNAVIMDHVMIGNESIVGALTFVQKGSFPERSMIVGNPAKIIKEVSDDMIAWKTKGTQLYHTLPKDCQLYLNEVQALTKIPLDRPKQEELYKTWEETRGNA